MNLSETGDQIQTPVDRIFEHRAFVLLTLCTDVFKVVVLKPV
jgi:hypothetical protein